MTVLQVLHFVAALIVLAEALNKLERTAPFAPGISPRKRCVDMLKALAWALLALGAGGGVVSPLLLAAGIDQGQAELLMRLERPTLAETAVMLGFATLIVRTRVKEG